MKKTLLITSVLTALLCQNFSFCADNQQEFKQEVDSLLSDLDSAESAAEENLIQISGKS